jgi:beta-ribofuranosylaminobenzene 5'-phosphate synthase
MLPDNRNPIVRVSSPSRLHLGMFSLSPRFESRFGGLGLMIQQPRTVVEACRSETQQLEIEGEDRDFIFSGLSHWFERNQPAVEQQLGSRYRAIRDLPIRISVREVPWRHQGLGSGTQLAMTSALALIQWLGLPTPAVQELARGVRRGKRSAIGSHGFFAGGLLVDRGKTISDQISPLDFRCDFPQDWPVIVFVRPSVSGMAGSSETAAFDRIESETGAGDRAETDIRRANEELVRQQILTGVLARDYPTFGEAVYEFGRNSGQLFAAEQGGVYNSQGSADLIHFIRQLRIPAVGQSSWGPGVFAIVPDADSARDLTQQVATKFGTLWQGIVTVADNHGCRVTVE